MVTLRLCQTLLITFLYLSVVIYQEDALNKVKVNKATGPDNIPPWILRDFSHILAAPLAAIYNSCLREGVLPSLWKTATIVPLPKTHPPMSVEKDIRPISSIACKVFVVQRSSSSTPL